MDKNFYSVKAGLLVVALAIAGISSGFQMTKIMAHFDRVHYAAAAIADDTMHAATHDVSHAVGKFMAHFHHAAVAARAHLPSGGL